MSLLLNETDQQYLTSSTVPITNISQEPLTIFAKTNVSETTNTHGVASIYANSLNVLSMIETTAIVTFVRFGSAPFASQAGVVPDTWMNISSEWFSESPASRTSFLDGVPGAINNTSAGLQSVDFTTLEIGALSLFSFYFSGELAEICIWTTALETWEHESLARGVRPKFIQPNSISFYLPLVDNIKPEIGNYNFTYIANISTNPIYGVHPTVYDGVRSRYPILQSGFDKDSVDTTIGDYQATRLENQVYSSESIFTEWKVSVNGGDEFTYSTTNNKVVPSGNVLGGSKNTLDLWLPPNHPITVRTRQFVNGQYSAWTAKSHSTSLGYVNSYDKYRILSRNTTTISSKGVENVPILTE